MSKETIVSAKPWSRSSVVDLPRRALNLQVGRREPRSVRPFFDRHRRSKLK